LSTQNYDPNQKTNDQEQRKNPSQQSGHNPNQQDPSKKNPQTGDQGQRDRDESIDQNEKRRAS
jgi:hypothetical protein